MDSPFDVEAAFGEDYLYFAAATLTDERSDADTATAVERAGVSAGAKVLDAACGTGRIANRLAVLGFDVTGVDRSAAYLELARADATSLGVAVDYRAGDLRHLPTDGPFDAVVCWFTSFGYFDDAENHAVLDEFHRVLHDHGTLVIDTLSHDGYVRAFSEAPESIVVELGDDMMVDTNRFDVVHGRVVTDRVSFRDGRRHDARFFVRLPTIPEWHEWLRAAGFSHVAVCDETGGPVDLDSWRILVTAGA